MSYYAVFRGKSGNKIYTTWDEAKKNCISKKGCKFKKFPTKEQAELFIKEKKGFTITNAEKWKNCFKVWTDGSSLKNGNYGGIGGSGYGVFFGDNHPDNKSIKLDDNATNGYAELMAMDHALQIILKKNYLPCVIYCDATYVLNGITKHLEKWKKTNFKKISTGKDVLYIPVWKNIDLNLNKIGEGKVWFTYVKGHSGNYGNDQADKLAVRASNRKRKNTNNEEKNNNKKIKK